MGAALLLALAGAGFLAKTVYDDAIVVRGHLEQGMSEAREIQRLIAAGAFSETQAPASRFAASTSAAVAATRGRTWAIGEAIPFFGANLSAVRKVAETANELAVDALQPATMISLDALAPSGGRIDVGALSSLASLLDSIGTAVNAASKTVSGIDQTFLTGQVSDAVDQFQSALEKADGYLVPAREVFSAIPHALGANGPRNYVLMLQGNAEARSLGGGAAAFIEINVADGQASIVRYVDGIDFKQPSPLPVAPLPEEAVAIYGDKIGRYTADFTMVPDFPTAANIFRAWWARDVGTPVDGVISIDPVALAYLLGVTGPVTLESGEVLTADNASSLLLNGIYFEESDPIAQNAFFALTASALFEAFTGSDLAPLPLLSALRRGIEEGRILYQSSSLLETELIAGSKLSGVLPDSNTDSTAIGIFINDNTASKKSYYLDLAVNACIHTGDLVEGQATLTSSLTEEIADVLPGYAAGPHFARGEISNYIVLYGPVGSTLVDVTVNGAPASILSAGEHLGRPAVKIDVLTEFASMHVIDFRFSGLNKNHGPLEIVTTPMSRATPTSATC